MAQENGAHVSAQLAVERALTKLEELLDDVRNRRLLHRSAMSAERANTHYLEVDELTEQFRMVITRGLLTIDSEHLSDSQIRRVVDSFRAVLSPYGFRAKSSPLSTELVAQSRALRSAKLRVARDFSDSFQRTVVAVTVQIVRQSAHTFRDVMHDVTTLATCGKKLESVRCSLTNLDRRLGSLWLSSVTVHLQKPRLTAEVRISADTSQKRTACVCLDKVCQLQKYRFLVMDIFRDRLSCQLAEHCQLMNDAQSNLYQLTCDTNMDQQVLPPQLQIDHREVNYKLLPVALQMSIKRVQRYKLRRVAVKRHNDNPRHCYSALHMHERFTHVLLELELFNDFNLRERLRPCLMQFLCAACGHQLNQPNALRPKVRLVSPSHEDAVCMANVRARLLRCVRQFRRLRHVRQPVVHYPIDNRTNRLRQIRSFDQSRLKHVEIRESDRGWWRSSYVESEGKKIGRSVQLLSIANQMKRCHAAIGRLDAALRVAFQSANQIERLLASLDLSPNMHTPLKCRLEIRLRLRTRDRARLASAKANFVFEKVVASVYASRHSLVFSSLLRATRLQDGKVEYKLTRFLRNERLARNVAKCAYLERTRSMTDLQLAWLWARWTLTYKRCLAQMTEFSWLIAVRTLPLCSDSFVDRKQHLTKHWTSPAALELDAAAQYALQRVADIGEEEQLIRLEFFRLHVARQLPYVRLSAHATRPARPSLTGTKQTKLNRLQGLQNTANVAYEHLVCYIKQHREAIHRRAYVTRVHKHQRGDRFYNMTSVCNGFVLGVRSAVQRTINGPGMVQGAVPFNLIKWLMRFTVLRQLQSFVMRTERMLDEAHVCKLEAKSLNALRNAFLLSKARVYASCAGGSTNLIGRIFLRGCELLYVIALESGLFHHSVAETPLEAAVQAAAKYHLVSTLPQKVADARSRMANLSEFEDVLREIRIVNRKLMEIRARILDNHWNATPWSQRVHLIANSQASSFTYCIDEMNDYFRRRHLILQPLDYCFFARHAIENRIRVLLGSGGRDCYSRTIRQIAMRRRRRINTLQLPPNLQHLTTNGYALKRARGLRVVVPTLFAEFAHKLRERNMFLTRITISLVRLDARNASRLRSRLRPSRSLSKLLGAFTSGAQAVTPLQLIHRELLLNAMLGSHVAIATGDGWHTPTVLPVERSVEETIECMRVGWLKWTRLQPKPVLHNSVVQATGKLSATIRELVSPWSSVRHLIRTNLSGVQAKSVAEYAWCSDPSLANGQKRHARPALPAVLEFPIECKFARIIEPASEEPREYQVDMIRQLRKQIESHSHAQLRHIVNPKATRWSNSNRMPLPCVTGLKDIDLRNSLKNYTAEWMATCVLKARVLFTLEAAFNNGDTDSPRRSAKVRHFLATLPNAIASFDRRCLRRSALHAPGSLKLLANCGMLSSIQSDLRLSVTARRECILQCIALARIFQRKLIREFSTYADQRQLRSRAENCGPTFTRIDALHDKDRLLSIVRPRTSCCHQFANVAIRRRLNLEFDIRVCSIFHSPARASTCGNTGSLVFVLSACNVQRELRNAFATLQLRRQLRTQRADRHAAVILVERSLANQHWQVVETVTQLASCRSKVAIALARANFNVYDATYRNRQWHLARECTFMQVRFGKRCLDESTWHLYARQILVQRTAGASITAKVTSVVRAINEELKEKFHLLSECVDCTAPHCFVAPFFARLAATHSSLAALLHLQASLHRDLQEQVKLKADSIRRAAWQKGLSCVSLFEDCVGKALSQYAISVHSYFDDRLTHARLSRRLNEQVKSLASKQVDLLRHTNERVLDPDVCSLRSLLLWLRQERDVTIWWRDSLALQTRVNQELIAVCKTHLRTFSLSRADLLGVDLRLDAFLGAEHEYIRMHFFKPPDRVWSVASARIKHRLLLEVREHAADFDFANHVQVEEKHVVTVMDDRASQVNTSKVRYSAVLNEMQRTSVGLSRRQSMGLRLMAGDAVRVSQRNSINDCSCGARQGSSVQLLSALRSSRKIAALDKRVFHGDGGDVENAVSHLNVINQLLAYNSICRAPEDFQQRALQAYFRASLDESMATLNDAKLQGVYQQASVNRAIMNHMDTHQQVIICCAVARIIQNVPNLQRAVLVNTPSVPNVRKSNKLQLDSYEERKSFVKHASAFGDTLDTIRCSKYLSNSILKHVSPLSDAADAAESEQVDTLAHNVEAASRKLSKRLFDGDEEQRLVLSVRRSSGRLASFQVSLNTHSQSLAPRRHTQRTLHNIPPAAETENTFGIYKTSLYVQLGDKIAGHLPAQFAFCSGDCRSVFITTLHLGHQAALKRVAEEEMNYRMRLGRLRLQPVALLNHEESVSRLQTVIMSVYAAVGVGSTRYSSLEMLQFFHLHRRLTARVVHEFIRCGNNLRRSLKHVDRECVVTLAGVPLSTAASSILWKFRALLTHRALNDADEKRFRAKFVRVNTQKQRCTDPFHGSSLVSQFSFRQLQKMDVNQCERFNYMTIGELESFCYRLQTVCNDADMLSELLDNLKMPSEARFFHQWQ